jgi:multiple sugar transport system substrate-binding protein
MSFMTGCNKGGESEDGIITITFAGRSNESEQENFRTFILEFMDLHPDIVVTIDWYANESAYNNALKGRLGSGLPDLFMLSDDQFIPYAEGGYLKDYKEYVDMDLLKTQVYEGLATSFCYNPRTDKYGWDPDDEDCGFYGYSKGPGTYALCYNKELFTTLMNKYNEGKPANQQITYPSYEHPMTYSEFITLNRNLIEAYYLAGNTGPFYPLSGYDLDSAVYSNNASYFNDDATVQQIDSDNFIEAVDFVASLYSESIIAPFGGVTASGEGAWINGRTVFWYTGPWKCKDYWSQIEFEWDICPVAVGPAEGALSTAYIGGMGYVMSNRITDSRKVAACAELAKYLCTDEASQRSQYKRGQSAPQAIALKNEYINDTYGLIGEKCPAGRIVWIDNVDGHGQTKIDANGDEYIDIMTCRFRPGKYTYSSSWKTDLMGWLNGSGSNGKSVWRGQISARDACLAYADTLQATLDELKDAQEW